MIFVALIWVTIISEAMIEAATLSAMISVAIILGASVKAVWMIVCEECGNKKAPTKLVSSKLCARVGYSGNLSDLLSKNLFDHSMKE